jgi:peptidyl-prolyl cis-trans isomerase A (cyclophilin A)
MGPTSLRALDARRLTLAFTLAGAVTLTGAAARADEPPPDPAGGKFTLEQATKGLPGPAGAPLVATIETSMGKFTCELYDKQAPITVANFVGLARGVRPWLDPKTNKWVKKPFYDGLIFHRVIPGFMIQGGDPLGVGIGNPGYKFEDEFSPDLKFDRPGLLAMANAGPRTNGSQFFITEGTPAHLTGRHTIFGHCEPVSLVTEIAAVEKGPRDKPVKDVVIKKVTIAHEKKGAAKPKAKEKTE